MKTKIELENGMEVNIVGVLKIEHYSLREDKLWGQTELFGVIDDEKGPFPLSPKNLKFLVKTKKHKYVLSKYASERTISAVRKLLE